MKRTLSILAVLGILSTISVQSAQAFSWSKLNPWSKCHKCEKQIPPCPCPTGYAAPGDINKNKTPCDPNKVTNPTPCDACDRLQQNMKK